MKEAGGSLPSIDDMNGESLLMTVLCQYEAHRVTALLTEFE